MGPIRRCLHNVEAFESSGRLKDEAFEAFEAPGRLKVEAFEAPGRL